jgi:hypothetical protein
MTLVHLPGNFYISLGPYIHRMHPPDRACPGDDPNTTMFRPFITLPPDLQLVFANRFLLLVLYFLVANLPPIFSLRILITLFFSKATIFLGSYDLEPVPAFTSVDL